MAVDSWQQIETTLATGWTSCICISIHMVSLDVCSTLADPTVLNYSGLNITCKLEGGAPWMLKLFSTEVHLIACSHVRISSCSASTFSMFSRQSVSEWEYTKSQHRRDWKEGGAATKDGAEQSAREQNCGKGLRRHTQAPARSEAHAYIPANMQAHIHPLSYLPHTLKPVPLTQTHTRNQTWLQSGPLAQSVLMFFSNHGKNPLSPLAQTYMASAFYSTMLTGTCGRR